MTEWDARHYKYRCTYVRVLDDGFQPPRQPAAAAAGPADTAASKPAPPLSLVEPRASGFNIQL